MSVFGVRKEFSDVNTPKTSISASTDQVHDFLPETSSRSTLFVCE